MYEYVHNYMSEQKPGQKFAKMYETWLRSLEAKDMLECSKRHSQNLTVKFYGSLNNPVDIQVSYQWRINYMKSSQRQIVNKQYYASYLRKILHPVIHHKHLESPKTLLLTLHDDARCNEADTVKAVSEQYQWEIHLAYSPG